MSANWLEILEQNEDQVREKLAEIYIKACSASLGQFRLTHSVILDSDSTVRTQTDTENTTDGAVWHGNAVYIGTIEDFIPWEDDYEWENWIEPSLTENEIKSIKEFAKIDECADANYNISFSTLEEFDKDLYSRVVDECIKCQIDNEMQDWIDSEVEMWKENQKMYQAQMEECTQN